MRGSTRKMTSAGAAIEPLEGRTCLSTVWWITWHPPPVEFDTPLPPPPALALPAPALALPGPSLSPFAPAPPPLTPVPLPAPATSAGFDLRGRFVGLAALGGDADAVLTLDITRQRRGRVTATLALPNLTGWPAVASTGAVSFPGNRRFAFTLSTADSQVTITGRFNRDGSVTGLVDGSLGGRPISAPFRMNRSPS
ncbi:MAG: hypothetical protein ACAI43_07350 [Phycisphaerae bacterium]|nr:hypothetical protein [Tepidisphaeraceae bacterium]